MSFQVPTSVLPVEGAQVREQPGVGEKGNYISTLQVIQQSFPEEIRCGAYLGEEAEMAKVVDEVLKANKRYVAKFGDKGQLPLPPARRFAILTCMDARRADPGSLDEWTMNDPFK